MSRETRKFDSSTSIFVLAASLFAVSGCGGSGSGPGSPGTAGNTPTQSCANFVGTTAQARDLGTFMPTSTQARSANGQAAPAMQKLHGHVIAAQAKSSDKGMTSASQNTSVTISLLPNNEAQLESDVAAMYTTGSPTYHKFITPQEFRSRYAPSADQVAQVQSYLQSQGLQNISVEPSGFLVHAEGPVSVMNAAFHTEVHDYAKSDGTSYHAPAYELQVPAGLPIGSVQGLQNLTVRRPHLVRKSDASANPVTGTGSQGGYAPADLRTAYNVPETGGGAGQTLAVFELDGYEASDITQYESTFGIPNVPLQNVLVDGSSGAASGASAEVTLDIELMTAFAPNASKILVYEGPNGDSGILDTYQKIATDNLATSISTSWGSSEDGSSSSLLQSENTVFMQMAAQGQTIFAAAGDSGAYDDGSTLSVDDPSSQPYVVAVGGTKLSTTSTQAWQSETTWNAGSASAGAGGGGISSVWSIPNWQKGVATAANMGSSTMRNTPDVSLHADESTGYAIYWEGSWSVWGGTSCAAPLWAAFTGLVNEQRISNGLPTIGLITPTLYALGESGNYDNDFHDINDGSTNLYYPAVTGYDNATGWGSFNGANLLNDLVNDSSTTTTGGVSLITSPGTASTSCPSS